MKKSGKAFTEGSRNWKNVRGEMDIEDYIKLQNETSKMLLSFDRQIQAKRKMMFDIEKENVMTIASSLRSIPKKAGAKKERSSGGSEWLRPERRTNTHSGA